MGALLLLAHAVAADPTFAGAQTPTTTSVAPSTTVSAELGGAWLSGNTVAYTLTGAVRGAHRWRSNKLSLSAAGMLGRAVADTDADGHLDDDERAAGEVETARKYEGEGRYDRFFGTRDSLYLLAGGFADPFAGYDAQVHGQVGWSHTFVVSSAGRLYAEAGADVAREDFVDGVTPESQVVLSARLLAGGHYQFNPAVRLDDQIEVLENVLDVEDVRVKNAATLTSALSTSLAVKLSYTLTWDHQPVEGFQPLDQGAVLTLVASLL